ncbi:MAG: hypothetical protein BA872_08370 [Desulfobacterales bacterium C00003060]|nr:MAG: hypothetical protein BA861_03030 [Desulfobacterales bacterium S3730MH5]OEU81635.1 MAG: hypothetical protein BA872_08370 [Desulfobacterales bacterium C00003060]
MKDSDSGPSRIGDSGVIQRTGQLAMPATGAFVVVYFYSWHGHISEKDFGVIDLVRKCDSLLYSKQILDAGHWMLDVTFRSIFDSHDPFPRIE